MKVDIRLDASFHGQGSGRLDRVRLNWFVLDERGPWSQQVHFEEVVKPILEHDLETFAQAGRPDNANLRLLRQENNPSFADRFKMNGSEGLS